MSKMAQQARWNRRLRVLCWEPQHENCTRCPVDETGAPCRDAEGRSPAQPGWTGPRDPKRCAELLGMKGVKR